MVSHFSSPFKKSFNKTKAIKPRSHCLGVRPCASRQFVAGEPARTGTNLEGIQVHSYQSEHIGQWATPHHHDRRLGGIGRVVPIAFIHGRQCYEPDPV